MKKILFVAFSMGIGGVERALTGVLNSLDLKKYQVHLRLVDVKGEFLNEIPKDVIVEELKEYHQNRDLLTKPLLPQIKDNFIRGKIGLSLRLMYLYLRYKMSGHYHSLLSYILKNSHKEKFDIAVAYAGPSEMIDYYIARQVEAKNKIAWVHFDIEKFFINIRSHKILYRDFDSIKIVSKEAKSKFEKQFPEFITKTEFSPNIIDRNQIINLSLKSPDIILPSFKGITILCVGRLSEEKGQDLAVEALAELKRRGGAYRLIFVGEGPLRNKLEIMARQLDLNDNIIFVGQTLNPYPYMRYCDIYLQPSRHEGFGLTLAEAKLFEKPIVATNFTGAMEQLEDYPIRSICEMNAESMAHSILKILKNE